MLQSSQVGSSWYNYLCNQHQAIRIGGYAHFGMLQSIQVGSSSYNYLCNRHQKYQPYASDPSLSGAFATVLWELNLLSKHYHPSVSAMASGISTMTTAPDQVVYRSNVSPQQAFLEVSLDKEKIGAKSSRKKSSGKRKRGGVPPSVAAGGGVDETSVVDEDAVRMKLSEHFVLVNEMEENERLRGEMERTKMALELYKQYKKQKKEKKR